MTKSIVMSIEKLTKLSRKNKEAPLETIIPREITDYLSIAEDDWIVWRTVSSEEGKIVIIKKPRTVTGP